VAAAIALTLFSPTPPLGAPPAATTAAATIFVPNPVQDLGDTSLRDRNDRDYAALAPAYHRRLLTDLDGSGTLTGKYIVIKSNTGPAAVAVDGAFPAWHRDDERFEQVMAYYWLTETQHYLQHLGFGDDLRPVRNDRVYVRVNQYGKDNAFYYDTGSRPTIVLGKGGIDAGEDGEAIVHEYGHAVQAFQFADFGDNHVPAEELAIGEGFSDYLAITATLWKAGPGAIHDPACWLDWISKAEGKDCIRRVDSDKHYPEDMTGSQHQDGEIWSSALWHIRSALGDVLAGRIIIDAQFDFAGHTSFAAAARKTVAAARRLGGPTAAAAVRDAFADRGIG
jgi:hypothetical protein